MSVTVATQSPDQALAELEAARQGTLALIRGLSIEDLERVHSPIMSPLVWDLGHIAAYEDLWLGHRHGGLELTRGELAEIYDAFETPRAVRGEIELLGTAEALAYLQEVRARIAEMLAREGIGDGTVFELVLRHELQHSETMRQTLAIAGLLPHDEPGLGAMGATEGWVEIPAGAFLMGSGPDGFAYDNERPRHQVEVGAFQLASRPVSNASWTAFAEGGGYERREWWSADGWAWRQEQEIAEDPGVRTGDPEAPVCHVSWFEADAFARAHDARLPTEAEWEKAVTSQAARPGGPGATGAGDDPAGHGSSPLHGVGLVWEWTQTSFHGYPGFVAHPYREYSEVFFGDDYRVLRGGSWATHPRIAGPRFRNWDLPQRRQIFSGLRLARDAR
jgi:iron(II)-dependent oxidoreductase